MGSAASANEDATKSTESTASTQPAVAEPKAAKRKATRSAGTKGPAAKRPAAKRPAAKRPAAKTERGETVTDVAADSASATPPGGPAAVADGLNGTTTDGTATADTSPPDASAAKSASTSTATKRRKSTRPRTRYAVGQQIVYPLQGVGRIERLEEREFQGNPTLYYVVYLEVSDMTIMIPVDKADSLGIRAIVSKRKAERALRLIAEDFDPIPTDWKLRYQMNLDLLKQGAVDDIASVVRSLSYRSRIKELPILERKLYDSALRLMVDEVSYSLGKDKVEIENLIEERLKNVKQKGDELPGTK